MRALITAERRYQNGTQVGQFDGSEPYFYFTSGVRCTNGKKSAKR